MTVEERLAEIRAGIGCRKGWADVAPDFRILCGLHGCLCPRCEQDEYLLALVDRYREALQYYADRGHYGVKDNDRVILDDGDEAREALAYDPEAGDGPR